jgi:hypothetical protein
LAELLDNLEKFPAILLINRKGVFICQVIVLHPGGVSLYLESLLS